MDSALRDVTSIETPNLVVFIADDHGYYETHFDPLSYLNYPRGSVGQDGSAEEQGIRLSTPNLDNLSANGLVFNRAYTCTAMCAPSRAALYTGLGPQRNGLHPNHAEVKPGTLSLPHYLLKLGYRVVLAGKKHILPREAFPFEYIPDDMNQVSEILKASEQPVCLIYASHEPHWPHSKEGSNHPDTISIPPYMIDTPETRELVATYWNDVNVLDQQIGDLLECVEASGRAEDTMFIYTSDHGACMPFAKWTLYEAGVRVPFIAYWPGVIEPRTTEAMINFTDIVPTFIELAGGQTPVDLDGRSIKPVLFGGAAEHRDLVFATHTNEGIVRGSRYPIRSVRNRQFNYIVNLEPDGRFTNVFTELTKAEREPYFNLWSSWKKAGESDPDIKRRVDYYQHRPAEELYDLSADPWELHNLAGDPRYADLKRQLHEALRAWMVQQGDCELASFDALDLYSQVPNL